MNSVQFKRGYVRPKNKILIIDDDMEMHVLFELFLRDYNYELFLCINFDDALNVLNQVSGKVDLILTDLHIEGAAYKANKFAEEVHENYPSMRVVLFTGFLSDEICINYTDFSFFDKLEKPFRRCELLECIDAALSVGVA